jgi:ribosomal protein L37AE/L43A
VADWLHQAGNKLEQQVYQTGEMVDSGTFECTGCGEHVVLRTPAHLPPCAQCRKVEFRRV